MGHYSGGLQDAVFGCLGQFFFLVCIVALWCGTKALVSRIKKKLSGATARKRVSLFVLPPHNRFIEIQAKETSQIESRPQDKIMKSGSSGNMCPVCKVKRMSLDTPCQICGCQPQAPAGRKSNVTRMKFFILGAFATIFLAMVVLYYAFIMYNTRSDLRGGSLSDTRPVLPRQLDNSNEETVDTLHTLPFDCWIEKARLDVQTYRQPILDEENGGTVQTPAAALDAFTSILQTKQDPVTGLKPFQIHRALEGLVTSIFATQLQQPGFADGFFKDPVVIVERAGQGDAHAQQQLGMMYEFGHRVPQDNETACVWYCAAAYNVAGKRESQALYASILANSHCFPFGKAPSLRDYPEAFRLWLSAAKKGHCTSAGCVGWCYYLGQGVPKNHCEALSWFYVAKGLDDGALVEDDTMQALIQGNDWVNVIDRMENVVGAQGALIAQEKAGAIIGVIKSFTTK